MKIPDEQRIKEVETDWCPEQLMTRKASARDKNTCPDCGAQLLRCKAGDIREEFSVQPAWAERETDARKCTAKGCGFEYLRIGPGIFHMTGPSEAKQKAEG